MRISGMGGTRQIGTNGKQIASKQWESSHTHTHTHTLTRMCARAVAFGLANKPQLSRRRLEQEMGNKAVDHNQCVFVFPHRSATESVSAAEERCEACVKCERIRLMRCGDEGQCR